MGRSSTWGLLPYAALVPVLRQVPSPASGFEAMPWAHAALIAALQAALFALHAWCYARWWPGGGAPRRLGANEAWARLWLLLFGFVVVAGHGGGPRFLAVAAPWAVATFAIHRGLVRRGGGYRAGPHFALWGVFLLGEAVAGVWALGAWAGR